MRALSFLLFLSPASSIFLSPQIILHRLSIKSTISKSKLSWFACDVM
jgi:hypothetical protein